MIRTLIAAGTILLMANASALAGSVPPPTVEPGGGGSFAIIAPVAMLLFGAAIADQSQRAATARCSAGLTARLEWPVDTNPYDFNVPTNPVWVCRH